MRTHLVTGGAGFIGSHLVAALLARGDCVRVLDNLSRGRLANLTDRPRRLQVLVGDVADADLLEDSLRGVDCVFHHAALPSVQRSLERPLESHAACTTGTLQVLEASRNCGVRRVVYAASSSAYGIGERRLRSEDQSTQPISPYGAAKLAGELYCQAFTRSFGLETVCLRYFNVFGPRQDLVGGYTAVIPAMITSLLEDERPTVFGDGRQSRDFTYVKNIVRANLLAADAPAASGRVLNIGSGRRTSLLALLQRLCRLLDRPYAPRFEPSRTGDIRHSCADIRLAQQILGYRPVEELEAGLRQTIAYYRDFRDSGLESPRQAVGTRELGDPPWPVTRTS